MPDPQEGTESRKSSSAEMKLAERYALRSVIPEYTPGISPRHPAAHVLSWSSRQAPANGWIPHTHANRLRHPCWACWVTQIRTRLATGLPQGEKPPHQNSSLESMQPLLPGDPADLTRPEGAGSTKPPSPIMMRAAMNQDQGRRRPTWRLPNHQRPQSSPVPTWRICRR